MNILEQLDKIAYSIQSWNEKNVPLAKTKNRYTTLEYQLRQRLDLTKRRLNRGTNAPQTHIPHSSSDPLSLISERYQYMHSCVYNTITYLQYLDMYTQTCTHNRGYFCRQRKRMIANLLSNPSILGMYPPLQTWTSTSDTPISQPLPQFLEEYLSNPRAEMSTSVLEEILYQLQTPKDD